MSSMAAALVVWSVELYRNCLMFSCLSWCFACVILLSMMFWVAFLMKPPVFHNVLKFPMRPGQIPLIFLKDRDHERFDFSFGPIESVRSSPKHHFGPREVRIVLVNRSIFGAFVTDAVLSILPLFFADLQALMAFHWRTLIASLLRVSYWGCDKSLRSGAHWFLFPGAPEAEQDLSVQAHQTFRTPNLTAFSVRLPGLEWLKMFFSSLLFVLFLFGFYL